MTAAASPTAPDIIKVRDVTKSYVGQVALQDVSFSVAAGRALAVAGHNGSGKSTLVKVLCGYVAADSGTGEFKGAAIDLRKTGGDWRTQLHVVHQDLGLVAQMSVAEQFGLTAGPVASHRELERTAGTALERFGVRV